MITIGINGFGRIGRYFTRLALQRDDINVAVVNDITDINTLAHLLKYDSVHGRFPMAFKIEENSLVFENGKRIIFSCQRNIEDIPWGENKVEMVVECTGLFLKRDLAEKHLSASVKRVVLSAPAKDDDIKTVVMGVNDHLLTADDKVISNASCTTNSAAPMVKVLLDICEIDSAFITTIHSYTSDQRLHDAPHKDLRRARAAALSIVPTSTGAAKAITKIFPQLDGHMGGSGVRVPVPDGSLTDLTLKVPNPPSVEEINEAMRKASRNELKGILSVTDEPIVSVDVIGDSHSCIFDSELTSVVGNMVKVVGWYDNEAGYSNRLVDLVLKLAK
jgi:glyceraldehyde 3-phosphate dehydrogenase